MKVPQQCGMSTKLNALFFGPVSTLPENCIANTQTDRQTDNNSAKVNSEYF